MYLLGPFNRLEAELICILERNGLFVNEFSSRNLQEKMFLVALEAVPGHERPELAHPFNLVLRFHSV
jgi:hypothetical protein